MLYIYVVFERATSLFDFMYFTIGDITVLVQFRKGWNLIKGPPDPQVKGTLVHVNG